MARVAVLYLMNLHSLQHFVVHADDKPYCARDALYVVFRAFAMKCENQELTD